MVYTGIQKPNNRIIAAGVPLIQELNIETVTNMYPGRLVKKGTNDSDIVINTADGKPIGWLGYEQTNPVFRPKDPISIYGAEAQVAVLNGGGFYIRAMLAESENVGKGDPLVAGDNGELKAAVSLAVKEGTDTADEVEGATPELQGSLVPGGQVIAYAEESINATSGATEIIVRSVI
ncbi:gp53 minor capsid family protein [Methanosalsum natronophilum]|uniref:gp53 minor capsid family protein n=1 Tax=Methanosalsum natronophilum TaxID=768733 RepID=UPI0021690634|nr:hypothetical protein [Methanosalsum natronophilum]MCS3924412.1 hypothetical protein [Methanosalsum natronophilum]